MRHLRDFSASLMFIQETGFRHIVLKYLSYYLDPNFLGRKRSTYTIYDLSWNVQILIVLMYNHTTND